MEKIEIKAVIKNMFTKDIHNDFVEILGDSLLHIPQVHAGPRQFGLDRTSTEDKHRECRPSTSLPEDNVKKLQISYWQIEE